MKYSDDLFIPYAKGQILTQGRWYISLGQIEQLQTIWNLGNLSISASLAWYALGDGLPVSRWKANPRSRFEINLSDKTYHRDRQGRLMIYLQHSKEIIVLYPTGRSEVSRTAIEGLP